MSERDPTRARRDEDGERTDRAGEDDDEAKSHVVTAFLRDRGEVLLLCRSDVVGTYAGQWSGVSGFAEGSPDGQVRVEIREETGLSDDGVSLVRSGRPIRFTDDDLEPSREWVVHPYLFDLTADSREIELGEEHDEFAWTDPTEIVAGDAEAGVRATAADSEATVRATAGDSGHDLETVPKLWTAYERVAPTVRSIAADDDHGAAFLSIRALEVLRDRAGLLVAEREAFGTEPDEEWDELAELATRLLEARPAMAVLRNRVNRAMATAAGIDATDAAGSNSDGSDDGTDGSSRRDATAVLETTRGAIDRAIAADADAAATAGEHIEGRVATLSRSGTVLEALRAGSPTRVFVAESRPAREGVAVAETLAADTAVDCSVTVHADAAAASVLATESIDRVVVGADTILPDGSVVNKTGTRALATAATREGVPVTVVAASDKVSTREEVNLESGDRTAVYDGDAPVDVLNPTFDVTPPGCVSEIVTERGRLEPAAVSEVTAELRGLEDWRAGTGDAASR
ncbi:NUDIX domain-containing protein [Natrialba swarupiae]|uniref:NUDIX domain-containing protein n=1 Tax=Natrialba swarupiae TaxID=2448032 RepID=A0A5D5AP53_9EURY|nr:NUDIX domain-containing protein [Natrialba swarupiae]TYT62687.1 NUDIX domain-containing protein [Natrialba swarupiae]